MMHDNVGYTPYEGQVVKGWPETVLSRGRVVVEGGELNAARGSGTVHPARRAGTDHAAPPSRRARSTAGPPGQPQ